jgi:hypothetical protein
MAIGHKTLDGDAIRGAKSHEHVTYLVKVRHRIVWSRRKVKVDVGELRARQFELTIMADSKGRGSPKGPQHSTPAPCARTESRLGNDWKS